MTQLQRLFLQLLKVGLGGQVDGKWPELDEVMLKELYRLASEQSVRGIAFDGLQKMNANRRGGTETILNWYAVVAQIEKRNELVNEVVPEVFEIFAAKGFHPVVMKGQVAAMEYNLPLRRESGDVDLYFTKEEGRRAMEMVKNWDVLVKTTSVRDVSFIYNDVSVELHPWFVHASHTNENKYNDRLQKWFEESLPSFKSIKIGQGGCDVKVPADVFHIIYIFYHLWIHFVKGGIGLRQICDWGMCLHNAFGKYDVEELRQKLEYFGLMRPWVGFAGILVDYLGLPEEEVPFYKKSGKTEKILSIIFKEGNFGHNIQHKPLPNDKYHKIFRLSFNTIVRYLQLCPVFPIDAAHYLPGLKSFRRFIKQ